ncbi:MAG: DNA-protecting protein DprA [Sulfurovum sp.]|nr:DNA-protecting protein DprA [Sulfurovaceae bacterium]
MIELDFEINALNSMKSYPKHIYGKGNVSLLNRPKISIVGTRRPSAYTRQIIYNLSKSLSSRGICIVSGCAMGIDAIAHQGAGADNTIAVMATSLDIRYPKVNQGLIRDIENGGLTLSQFPPTFRATPWSFVLRNELVVALGDFLIVGEADINSGSMHSVKYAINMGKKIFVLPHRLGESRATNQLLQDGIATPIYDIEDFSSQFGQSVDNSIVRDDFFYFCQTEPTIDSAIIKFGDKVYEAELEGLIIIENGLLRLV